MAESRYTPHFEMHRLLQPHATREVKKIPRDVQSLTVWMCSVPSFEFLKEMSGIRKLVIGSWPDPSFEPLQAMKQLTELEIAHFPRVTDLRALDSLDSLEVLKLTTLPSWDVSGKISEFVSYKPLLKLTRLQSLELRGIRSLDRSLPILAKLPALQELELSDHDQLEDLARFAAACPRLEPSVKPTWESNSEYLVCKKCGDPRILLRGLYKTRRSRWACKSCHAKRIAKHVAEFEALKNAARQAL